MRRALARRLGFLSFVFLTATAESCFSDFTEPADPYQGMEGTWVLTQIDGKPIPAGGYELIIRTGLPLVGDVSSGYFLVSGSLAFAEPTQGQVVGAYVLKSNQVNSPEDFYSGSFVYDGSSKVTLRAGKDKVVGNVDILQNNTGSDPYGELTIKQTLLVKNPLQVPKTVPVDVNVKLVRFGGDDD